VGADLMSANLMYAELGGTILDEANLHGTDLRGAEFDLESIKKAKNWQHAIFDDEIRQKLGLMKPDDEAVTK
jgi:uncharacterized protein YjbI with pentapeptide repeats